MAFPFHLGLKKQFFQSCSFLDTVEDRSPSMLASQLSPIIETNDDTVIAEDDNSENDESQEQKQICSPGYIRSPSGITMELLGQDLWKKFYKLGTEMIITKAGR